MACSVTSVTRWRHSVKMPRQDLTGIPARRQRPFSSYGTTLSGLGIVSTCGSAGMVSTADDRLRPDTDGDDSLEFWWSPQHFGAGLPFTSGWSNMLNSVIFQWSPSRWARTENWASPATELF